MGIFGMREGRSHYEKVRLYVNYCGFDFKRESFFDLSLSLSVPFHQFQFAEAASVTLVSQKKILPKKFPAAGQNSWRKIGMKDNSNFSGNMCPTDVRVYDDAW